MKTHPRTPLSHGGGALFRLSFCIPPCDDPVELFEVSLRLPILGLLLAQPAAVPVNEVREVDGAQYDEDYGRGSPVRGQPRGLRPSSYRSRRFSISSAVNPGPLPSMS